MAKFHIEHGVVVVPRLIGQSTAVYLLISFFFGYVLNVDNLSLPQENKSNPTHYGLELVGIYGNLWDPLSFREGSGTTNPEWQRGTLIVRFIP